MDQYTPIEVAVALSLYTFNVSVDERIARLCATQDYLEPRHIHHEISHCQGAFAATELSHDLAVVYVDQAMERYGKEAKKRVSTNARAHEAKS